MNLPGMVNRTIDSVHKSLLDVLKVINGGVSFGDGPQYANANLTADAPSPAGNMAGVIVKHTFVGANTPTTITHNLNRTPVGYLVVEKSAACDVFDGNVNNWSSTSIELEATTTSTVKLFIY